MYRIEKRTVIYAIDCPGNNSWFECAKRTVIYQIDCPGSIHDLNMPTYIDCQNTVCQKWHCQNSICQNSNWQNSICRKCSMPKFQLPKYTGAFLKLPALNPNIHVQWRAIQTILLTVYEVKWGHFERAKMTLKMLPAS